MIDFDGPKLSAIPKDTPPRAVTACSTNAVIQEVQVFYNPHAENWRVILKFEPVEANTEPVELQCRLAKGEEALTETWTYLWNPH
ncbi:MAG: glucan biosynthesis protein [Verrucomicrobiae bacterium]|nr:glucan biosynthesis protein [Verrucomicrobiae bacterium]